MLCLDLMSFLRPVFPHQIAELLLCPCPRVHSLFNGLDMVNVVLPRTCWRSPGLLFLHALRCYRSACLGIGDRFPAALLACIRPTANCFEVISQRLDALARAGQYISDISACTGCSQIVLALPCQVTGVVVSLPFDAVENCTLRVLVAHDFLDNVSTGFSAKDV